MSDAVADADAEVDAESEDNPAVDVDPDGPVVLFDGVCNFCSGVVRFLAPRDDGELRFASLQSAVGQALLCEHDLPTDDFDSFVLVENGEASARSTAALRVCRHLRFPWSALAAFLVVPRPIRDRVYDVVAANRYDWFGRKDQCMLPTAELRERFLGGVEGGAMAADADADTGE